jgi:ATP-binding cassette subfamily F protein 3
MTILTAYKLAKAYGDHDVLRDISLSIPHQARIGLVGRNGVGKTTLLKLLAGQESPDGGRLQHAAGSQIAYLPQDRIRSNGDGTLWQYCLEVFRSLQDQERELAALEQAMGDPRKTEQAMARYTDAVEEYERSGGYLYASRIRRVLTGLGFDRADFEKPLDAFSGGERTRAELARLILEDPDLLLLDEPTNHLDLASIEWLESWLASWPGAAMIVSHDRYFLSRSIQSIWEISSEGLELYRGGYEQYLDQRAERATYRTKRYASQQQHIQKEQDYIRRNIAGQNSRQAKGRQKRLKGFIQGEVIEQAKNERQLRIGFEAIARSGDEVLKTENLEIAHPRNGVPLLAVPDLLVKRGERIAIIGPNGAGKTTLLRTLIGELAPYRGEIRMGANLTVGYLRQAQADLNPDLTIMEEIMNSSPELLESQARNLLGQFLFSGDTVFQRIRDLSGGEQSRVALAKLALAGANLLLLDEPTNHLDLASQEILEQALQAFPGTLLLVSHDRYLVNRLATKTWFLHPALKTLEAFEGGYDDYRERVKRPAKPIKRLKPSKSRESNSGASEHKLGIIEEKVEAIEAQLSQLEADLSAAGSDVESIRELGQEYAKLESELDQQLVDWERLARAQPKSQ